MSIDLEILEFIKKHGPSRYMVLYEEFVKTGRCSEGTLKNHLKKLRPKYLIKRIDEKTGRPVYDLPRYEKAPRLSKPKSTLEDGVKKTYVIAAYAKTNPHIKYWAIADKFGVKGTREQKKSYVKQCVHRLKHGKIRLTREQIERIAAEYA